MAALLAGDGGAVHQQVGAHQHLGAPGTQLVAALPDEQPVAAATGAGPRAVLSVPAAMRIGAAAPMARRGLLPDPADRARAVVAGQDQIADHQILDPALLAARQRQMRPGEKADRGDIGEMFRRVRGGRPDQVIFTSPGSKSARGSRAAPARRTCRGCFKATSTSMEFTLCAPMKLVAIRDAQAGRPRSPTAEPRATTCPPSGPSQIVSRCGAASRAMR